MAKHKGGEFPGVSRNWQRGKLRWRFKKHVNGVKVIDAYIDHPYGSTEFKAAYEALLRGAEKPVFSTAVFGTVGWIIEQFMGDAQYLNASDSRRNTLRREFDWLKQQAGTWPLDDIRTRHVEHLMGMKTGPTAANTVRKNLSTLFNFGIRKEWLTVNPAKKAMTRKENDTGYHTWTEEEISRFLDTFGAGTKPRLAMLLVLSTGAARQDVIRLGWQNVKNGRISYRRGKTGQAADLPILPELWAELDRLPRNVMLFLHHGAGHAYKPESFANWFKDQCTAAGLPHCSTHGLRKAGATRLAEHGATEFEIMAFLAHKTPHEAATYTKAAGRARLADGGMSKLPSFTKLQGNSDVQDTETMGK
ncbi:tyrosine-type recombinase/integrase [Paracoccus amoyensis]